MNHDTDRKEEESPPTSQTIEAVTMVAASNRLDAPTRIPLPEEKKIARDDPGITLAPGMRMGGFQIERLLGQGGFGITYQALDLRLGRRVAIKEYMPVQLAVRSHADQTVQPRTVQHLEPFERFRQRFLEEGRILARFSHPHLVRVLTLFEDNNTAYLVMEFEEGTSLSALLKKEKTLPEARLLSLTLPLLNGLEALHQAGVVHRDIKPGNIYLRDRDGSPVLLDFGSARSLMVDGVAQETLTMLLTPGYAPVEQYFSDASRQGPWTDIHAMGATLYHAMTGHRPLAAFERSRAEMEGRPDPLPSVRQAAPGKYSEPLLQAIEWAMRLSIDQRPRSVGDWLTCFPKHAGAEAEGATETLPRPAPPAPSAPSDGPSAGIPPKAHSGRRIALLAGLLLLVIGSTAYLIGVRIGQPIPPASPRSAAQTATLQPLRVHTLGARESGMFHAGEAIRLRVRAETAGYLYLFDLDDRNTATQLAPFPGADPIHLTAGQTLDLPSAGVSFDYVVQPPYGRDRIWSILTSSPLHLPDETDPLWRNSSAFVEHVRQMADRQGLHGQAETWMETRP
ncbi:MAG: protein kinase [Magnetococcales bacterium]|nr:protein kinase [Magnetococcales bacterium]